jgi:hypothetical protein
VEPIGRPCWKKKERAATFDGNVMVLRVHFCCNRKRKEESLNRKVRKIAMKVPMENIADKY